MSINTVSNTVSDLKNDVDLLIANRNSAYSIFNAISLTYGLSIASGSTDFETYSLTVGRDALFTDDVYIEGSLNVISNIDISGNIIANQFIGDGSLLTNVNATWTRDESSNDISYVDGKVFVTNDVSFGSNLQVNGDLIINSIVGIGTTTPTVALDISSTDSIKIPVGTTSQRPDIDEVGQVRYNSTSSLYEVYTNQTVWSGLPTHKTDQPPFLLNITIIKYSETVTIQWEKFNEIYKDVFDGKSYPIYLQTIIDISFTDINDISSSGWKTLYIGNGNYNTSGIYTTPLTEIIFDSINGNTYTNETLYDIEFEDKPDTISLPTFSQNDTFDLRIYGVNRSESLPNYIYLNDVQLKVTGEPGPITIIEFNNFSKTQMNIDLSFNLDSQDPTITNGISIVHYDISFMLINTKSYETITHVDNFFVNWINNISLTKSDIVINGLYPGAQYDVQVRAQNALNIDENNDYTYGEYGDIFPSSGFTNNSGNIDGISTTQYINTSDLNDINPTGMTFTLENATNSIQCNIVGTQSLSIKTILNTNGYISIDGSSTFYLNYGIQGTNFNNLFDVVTATIYSTKNGINRPWKY